MGCKETKDPVTVEIDRIIKSDARESKPKKILLLGTGDAGKTTFLKQMKISFSGGFPSEELTTFATLIRDNTIQAMKVLLQCCMDNNVKLPEKLQNAVTLVMQSEELTKECAKGIKSLWKYEGVRMCFEEKEHLLDIPSGRNAVYFFQNAGRFIEKDYIPTHEDVVRIRGKTVGIKETLIQGKPPEHSFRFIDVGGQRSERRKWISCFDDSDAVIFLSAINEYDMTLCEDNNIPRFEESLTLFRNITQGKWFQTIPWIVFLNKTDLFQDKVKKVPLGQCFNQYEQFLNDKKNREMYELNDESNEVDRGLAFFEFLFRENFKSKSDLFVYETNALDTEACVSVFKALKADCFARQMNEIGLGY